MDKGECEMTCRPRPGEAKGKGIHPARRLPREGTICGAVVFGVAMFAGLAPASADGIQTAGEVLRIALPVAAGGYSLYRDDYDGILQLGVSEVISEGLSYGLSRLVREQRPDKSDWHSFPSDSTAISFSAASYLQVRYGWDYGLPAYALAAFVGYSRVESKQHHWGDVAAGAFIGWGASELTTVRYRNIAITASPGFRGLPMGFSLAAIW
jgi:membrane-associated phospholipid phosphatase